jgi:5-methyltetrahydrofolate--homocysteine methyltransferase
MNKSLSLWEEFSRCCCFSERRGHGYPKSIEEDVVNGNIEEVRTLTQTALDKNLSPMDILNNGLVKGMERIGKLFECQEVFVPEILLAAMAMKEGLSLLKPFLEKREIPLLGKWSSAQWKGMSMISVKILSP